MKLSTEEQFFSNDEVEDTFYVVVRDKEHHQETREFVKKLWQRYKLYAEPDFLKNAKKKDGFHAKTWEMYLGCVFLENGLSLQKKLKIEGPDLHLLCNKQSIWIEAVAPSEGIDENAVPGYNYGVVSEQPTEKIILRLTNSISEKYKQYWKYIAKGFIKPGDIYVIAINGGRIPHSIMEQNIPYIVKAVLPFGNQVVTLDSKSHKIVDSQYEYKDTITKANGSSVSTNIFKNKDYNGISALLYSPMNVVTHHSNKAGIEINLVHNPIAVNKLHLGIFPFGTEWWVEGEELINKQWEVKTGNEA